MKRPRENSLSTCRENEIPLSQLEGIAGEGLCPLVATSPREHGSRQRHCSRRKHFLPKNSWFGACFIAVLAFGMASLPAAHALSSTRNMAAANSPSFEDVVIRRIEETNSDETSSSNTEECNVPVSECMQCSYSEQKAYEACKETGRWQKFKCVMPGYTGSQDDEYKHEMKSCKHTNFDNGLAMFQFQILCLLIGVLSIMSVKKQKKVSMSMFDRRKQQEASAANPGNSKRRNSMLGANGGDDDEEDIEFTPMTNQQRERVPLVARMEVI